MYKSFISLTLLCFIALFAAGCGSDDAAEAPAEGQTTTVAKTTDLDAKQAAEETKPKQSAPEAQKTTPKPPSISAQALYDQYQKDSDGADKLYKGKTIRVSGVIWKIDTKENERGIPYLTLKTSSMFGSVICFFNRDQIPALQKLKKGAKITLSGKCNGQKVGVQNVDIVDCTL